MRTACTQRRLLAALLARLLAAQVGLPRAAAQTATSGAEDKRVLREAKAAADTSACTCSIRACGYSSRNNPCPLDSWTADTEPCGDGYRYYTSGWLGVMCDARGGRVVRVYLWSTGVGGELLPFFGRLGALLSLRLADNPALHGDVADLAGATELRNLDLGGCPLVVGEAAALAALVHLGGEYTVPGCSSSGCTGGLYLGGSGVHGPVAALRALPGLGADWGTDDSPTRSTDFTPCSAFGGQQIAGHYDRGQYVVDAPWGTGSPGCGAAGLAPVAVSPNALLLLLSFPELSRGWRGRARRSWRASTRAPAAIRNQDPLLCPA
eukprot:COSAG04_NODE_1759_length_5667_cov_2.268139_6_plen_322_part_00